MQPIIARAISAEPRYQPRAYTRANYAPLPTHTHTHEPEIRGSSDQISLPINIIAAEPLARLPNPAAVYACVCTSTALIF